MARVRGPSTRARTTTAVAVQARWKDAFHTRVMIAMATRATSTVTTSAVNPRGAPARTRTPTPTPIEAADSSNGIRRCSRTTSWRSPMPWTRMTTRRAISGSRAQNVIVAAAHPSPASTVGDVASATSSTVTARTTSGSSTTPTRSARR